MHRDVPAKVLTQCHDITEPAYIYDLSQLTSTARSIQGAFSGDNTSVLFATMANPRPEILETLSGLQIGACVNSTLHLKAAMRAGISREKIQYTSSGMSTADMAEIAALNIPCNVDSLGQAELFLNKTKNGSFGIRVNTGLLLGKPLTIHDRLGVDPDDIPLLRLLAASKDREVIGAHIYVGTNFSTHLEMLPALDRFFEVAARIPSLTYVNIGGGIGVDYAKHSQTFDIDEYARAVEQRMNFLRSTLGCQVQLVVEPGRAMVASCGYFTCKITDIKRLGGQTFVGVNASVAQFPRPWHHPEIPHKIYTIKSESNTAHDESASTMAAVIVGRTTYSKDVLSVSSLPSDIKVGDALVFADAGAYSDSMASRFLGQQDAHSIFLN